jgi:two-component system, OmpR family, sensor kinase
VAGITHRSLRTRLVVSLVLVAAAALLLADVASVVAIRRGAERAARQSLEHKAANIQDTLTSLPSQLATGPLARPAVRLRDALDQLRSSVRVSDARLVFVTPSSTVASLGDLPPRVAAALQSGDPDVGALISLPDGLPASALDFDALRDGSSVAVREGNQEFVAQPLRGPVAARFVPVVVIGEDVDTGAAHRASFAILIAGSLALVVCAISALWIARRLTRPLAAIEQTAHRLAAGDLAARVAITPGTDAELAAVAGTLNRMAAELDQARHSERAFLQAVSHDLRTPLTSIRGYAEALADGTLDATDAEARARAASVIATEARRLERLVRDLLDLSRLDAREFTLRPRPGDAAAVVRETAAGFAPRASEVGVALDVDAPRPVPADVDPERLGQVVANLVENALKYARTRVTVSVGDAPGAVVLRVQDDGPGIPPDEQARVFERLYLARNGSGRAIGTGLGLAIVRQLTRAMGGDVQLERSDANGTSFVATVAR